ncbi:hypothetical protein AYI70_g2987, partial [Smittium culicis]
AGALLGSIEKHEYKVVSSFELLLTYNADLNIYTFDIVFLRSALAQQLQVNPELEFVGWYSTTARFKDEASILLINKQLLECGFDPKFTIILESAAIKYLVTVNKKLKPSHSPQVPIFNAYAYINNSIYTIKVQIQSDPSELVVLNHLLDPTNFPAKSAPSRNPNGAQSAASFSNNHTKTAEFASQKALSITQLASNLKKFQSFINQKIIGYLNVSPNYPFRAHICYL